MRVFGVTPLIGRTKWRLLMREGHWARLQRDYGYNKYIPADERFEGGPDYIFETARRAYLEAAKRCHEDHGGTTEAMQLVNAAWAYIERRYGPEHVTWTRESPAKCAYRKWMSGGTSDIYHHCRLDADHAPGTHWCGARHVHTDTVCGFTWATVPQAAGVV